MTRYAIDKVLWDIYRDRATAETFVADPAAVLTPRDLTAEERDALLRGDLRALLTTGAHPFLLYNFALRLEGHFSIPFTVRYVTQLRGLEVGDITT